MSTIRETVDGLRGDGRGWMLLFVAAGWLFVSGFRIVLPALLPQVKADLVIDNASAGFALTVLWATYALMQFPAGIVADRLGERRLLVAGAVLGALAFALFYVVPFFAVFLVACATFGVGVGLFGTPRDMFLSRTYPAADNTAYGVTFAAGSLGAAVLPYAATAIGIRFGWRAAVVWLLPFLLAVGVGLWWSTSSGRGGGTGDRLAVGSTVRRTLGALTDRSVLAASGVMILFIFTYQGLLSFLPTYLVEVKDLDQGLAAGLFGLLFVVGAVVQPVAGHLADQYGQRTIVLGVIAASTATLAALPFTGGLLALALVVPALGVRIAVGPLTSAFAVSKLPREVRGAGWGLLRTVFFGVGATGSSFVGLFADADLFDLGFLILAGMTGLTAFFWVLIPDEET